MNALQPFNSGVANISRKRPAALMKHNINKNNFSCPVYCPACQETKVPVVFQNEMLRIRCKEQVSGLSPKETALKTLVQP